MKKIMEHERSHLRENGNRLHGSYPADIDVDTGLQQCMPLKKRSKWLRPPVGSKLNRPVGMMYMPMRTRKSHISLSMV